MAAGARRHGKAVALAYRAEVAVRTILAIVGGYFMTALGVIALARLLPLPPYEASEAATMLAFVLGLVPLMAAFAVRRLWQVIAGFVVTAAALVAIIAATGPLPTP